MHDNDTLRYETPVEMKGVNLTGHVCSQSINQSINHKIIRVA